MAPADQVLSTASNTLATGEYGATRVGVTSDGSLTRIAFGRNGPSADTPVFYLAVFLSEEAAKALKDRLNEIFP